MSFDINAEIWQLCPFGFDNDDSGGNDQSNGGDNQGGNNQGQQQNSSSTNDAETDTDDDPYAGLSARELKRIAADNAKRAKDAETERDSAKNQLTAKEREKLDKEQRQELEITDLKNENAKLRATNAKLALIGAIRDDKRFEWHNPEMVAAQLDSEKVKVDDNGKVEGHLPLLSKIAKDDSLKFMLKSDNTQSNNQQQDTNQQQNSGTSQATGVQPGQGGANQGGSMPPNAAELAELMPALRSRI